MIQPTPSNPNWPTACGPSSHSPLPMEMPSAIRLGPSAYLTSSLGPIRRTPKTSSGVGRSVTGRSGRLTPSAYVPVTAASAVPSTGALPWSSGPLPVGSGVSLMGRLPAEHAPDSSSAACMIRPQGGFGKTPLRRVPRV